MIDSYEYDAYGNSFTVSGATPNEMMYRGEQFDSDLGLYYLRARYYNPLTGRFMSRDPEDGHSWDPKSLHKYLYAGGDPVNGRDPRGREDDEEEVIDLNVVQSWEVETGLTQLSKRLIGCFLAAADTVYNTVEGWTAWGAGQDAVALRFCLFP
jgi:RHS repeat-associated protein